MKKSIQQFAQEIRLSFPNAYQQLSNETVVELWLYNNPQMVEEIDFGYPVPENLRKFVQTPQHSAATLPPPNYQGNPTLNAQTQQQFGNGQYNQPHGNYNHGQFPPPPYGGYSPNQGAYPQQPMPQQPTPPYGMPQHQYEPNNPLWKRLLKIVVVLVVIWLFVWMVAELIDQAKYF